MCTYKYYIRPKMQINKTLPKRYYSNEKKYPFSSIKFISTEKAFEEYENKKHFLCQNFIQNTKSRQYLKGVNRRYLIDHKKIKSTVEDLYGPIPTVFRQSNCSNQPRISQCSSNNNKEYVKFSKLKRLQKLKQPNLKIPVKNCKETVFTNRQDFVGKVKKNSIKNIQFQCKSRKISNSERNLSTVKKKYNINKSPSRLKTQASMKRYEELETHQLLDQEISIRHSQRKRIDNFRKKLKLKAQSNKKVKQKRSSSIISELAQNLQQPQNRQFFCEKQQRLDISSKGWVDGQKYLQNFLTL